MQHTSGLFFLNYRSDKDTKHRINVTLYSAKLYSSTRFFRRIEQRKGIAITPPFSDVKGPSRKFR